MIAKSLEIPGHDDPETDILLLVKNWLQTKLTGRWVMVIDSADDAELFTWQQAELNASGEADEVEQTLARFIPDCAQGSILITSQNKKAAQALTLANPIIEVQNMSDEEAHRLICTIIGGTQISRDEALLLASRLEHLPLAIAQAAFYITGNSISIKDYVKLLDDCDSEMVNLLSKPFETVGRDSETPRAVTATWIISFELVKKRDALAARFLSFLSFFDHRTIPRDFVIHFQDQTLPEDAKSGYASDVTTALGTLMAFSFVSEHQSKNLDMHRLVHLVTRKWVANQNQVAEFEEHALDTMCHFFPHGSFETREVCMEYLPHVHAVLQHQSTRSDDGLLARSLLLHRMAGHFNYQGQWKEAEKRLLESISIEENLIQSPPRNTLASKSNLAMTYFHLGNWNRAEEIIVSVLETQMTLGEEITHILSTMTDLAAILWAQGRFTEAEDQETQAIQIATNVLSETDSNLLTLKSHLASTYVSQGRFEAAKNLFIEVLEKNQLVEDHPETLIDTANLASVLRDQGNFKDAEKLETRVLEIRSRVQGDEHPDTLSSMAGLAATFSEQGRYFEAHDLQQSVLRARESSLGEEHPDTLEIMDNLATTLSELGNWKDAEALQIRAVEIGTRELPQDHPQLLVYMAGLAVIYHHQNRSDDAVKLLDQVLQAQISTLGEKHPATLNSMDTLGGMLVDGEDIAEALNLCSRAAELSPEMLGHEHHTTLVRRFNLSIILKKYKVICQGNEAEEIQGRIEKLQLDVVEKSKATLGDDHPDTLSRMSKYADTLREQGRFEEAGLLRMQIWETTRAKLGDFHWVTMICMSSLLDNWTVQGQRDEATSFLQDAIVRSQHCNGPDAPITKSLQVTLEKLLEQERPATKAHLSNDGEQVNNGSGEVAAAPTVAELGTAESTRGVIRRNASRSISSDEPPRKISKRGAM